MEFGFMNRVFSRFMKKLSMCQIYSQNKQSNQK